MTEASARRPADVWASGDAYEPYVGRWSRHRGAGFRRLARDSAGLAAGSTSAAAPARLASRSSTPPTRRDRRGRSVQAYTAYARRRFEGQPVEVKIGDARALPVADGAFDAVVSGLIAELRAGRRSVEGRRGMMRAARPGGTVGAYVWDYAGGCNSCAISGTPQSRSTRRMRTSMKGRASRSASRNRSPHSTATPA